MYGSEEGGEASFSLYDNTEQEDADRAGGEEKIQQAPPQAHLAQGSQGIGFWRLLTLLEVSQLQ